MDEQRLLNNVMESFCDVCYISDLETYDLIYINNITKKLLGISNNSYIGRACYDVIQGRTEPCTFCSNKKLVKGEFLKSDHYYAPIKRYFEMSGTIIEIEGRKARLEFGIDISDRKFEIAQLKNKLTLEETLFKCVKTLSESKDIKLAINDLLAIVCEFFKADRSYIFEFQENGKFLDNTYEWCFKGSLPQIKNLQDVPMEAALPMIDKFEEIGGFFITSLNEELDKESSTYKILEMQEIESMMAAPLIKDGEIFGFLGVDNPTYSTDDISLIRSISLFITNDLEKKSAIDELERIGYKDAFTGLYNRRKYMQVIKEIEENKPNSVGIIYLDVNGMKQINDEYGHEYGDMILLKVSSLLIESFSNDVFRTGGDEFLIIYNENDRVIFEEKVNHLRRILGRQTDMSISIGSTWCTDTANVHKQIAHADELMYIDKQGYYKNTQFNRKNYRAQAAKNLNESIELGEFVVFLQPKVNLSNGQVVGVEALVRKKDGKGGLISPDKFISIYESEGIIGFVDFHVLERACQLLKKWKEESKPLIPISINFSRITILEHNIAQKVVNICEQYGIEPELIKIELTEQISNIDTPLLAEILDSIKERGFKISLDDFGSNYSNLTVLVNVGFDEIKLDKSLINDIVTNLKSRILLQYIVEMCNAFENIETVAEGIETYEQLEILRENNCVLGQGFYFAKPLPIDDFQKYYLEHV